MSSEPKQEAASAGAGPASCSDFGNFKSVAYLFVVTYTVKNLQISKLGPRCCSKESFQNVQAPHAV